MDAGHTHATSSYDSRGIFGLNIFLVVIAVATLATALALTL